MAFSTIFPHQGKLLDLTALFARELELCKIEEGQTVVVLTDTRMDPSYPDAWVAACITKGIEVIKATTPYTSNVERGSHAKRGPRGPLLDLLKKVDMVVEADTAVWLYDQATTEILTAGGRILLVQSNEEILRALFPTKAHIRRTYKLAEMFEKAEEIRVTSQAGTDFTCNKKGRKCAACVGIVDRPGRWDNMGSGDSGSAPLEDSAYGTMVIDVGEPYSVRARWPMTTDRIKLTLKDGKITKIEGKGDAKILESWFVGFNDERSYIMAHVNIGTHENASWASGEYMDWESVPGAMTIAFGKNIWSSPDRYSGFEGKNDAPSHLDTVLRNCSCYLDDEKILDKGKFINPDLK